MKSWSQEEKKLPEDLAEQQAKLRKEKKEVIDVQFSCHCVMVTRV